MKALSIVTIVVIHRPTIALSSLIFVAIRSLPCKCKVSYSDKGTDQNRDKQCRSRYRKC